MIKIICQTGRDIIINSTSLLSCDFSMQDLHRALLEQVNLSGSNFVQADLRGILLNGSTLTDCNFNNSRLMNGSLCNTVSNRATFIGAGLIGACFDGSDLRDSDFSMADVEFASFCDVDIRGANFTCQNIEKAVLSNIVWDEKTLFPDNFDPNEISQTVKQ
jgi:uncharacterized protein YjbI with pentapeptide repeats